MKILSAEDSSMPTPFFPGQIKVSVNPRTAHSSRSVLGCVPVDGTGAPVERSPSQWHALGQLDDVAVPVEGSMSRRCAGWRVFAKARVARVARRCHDIRVGKGV